MGAAEGDLLALASQVHGPGGPQLLHPFADLPEVLVAVVRIVVEEQESLRGRETSEVGDVLRAGVSEPGTVRVLLLGVLAVVDQHVGPVRDLETRHPLGLHRGEIDRERRLVIGEIGEAAAPVLDPVAHGGTSMDDRPGDDRRGAEHPRLVRARRGARGGRAPRRAARGTAGATGTARSGRTASAWARAVPRCATPCCDPRAGRRSPGPPDDRDADGSTGCRCVSAPCRPARPRAPGSPCRSRG